jgi:truncated hemoglobin YjbI
VTAPTANPSMYARIGGAPTVRRVVDRLYAWIFHDDVLYLRYFANVDKPTLKAHMVRLLSQVLGGPTQYRVHIVRVPAHHLVSDRHRPCCHRRADRRAALLAKPVDDEKRAAPEPEGWGRLAVDVRRGCQTRCAVVVVDDQLASTGKIPSGCRGPGFMAGPPRV